MVMVVAERRRVRSAIVSALAWLGAKRSPGAGNDGSGVSFIMKGNLLTARLSLT
jgi:hypothetical protein